MVGVPGTKTNGVDDACTMTDGGAAELNAGGRAEDRDDRTSVTTGGRDDGCAELRTDERGALETTTATAGAEDGADELLRRELTEERGAMEDICVPGWTQRQQSPVHPMGSEAGGIVPKRGSSGSGWAMQRTGSLPHSSTAPAGHGFTVAQPIADDDCRMMRSLQYG